MEIFGGWKNYETWNFYIYITEFKEVEELFKNLKHENVYIRANLIKDAFKKMIEEWNSIIFETLIEDTDNDFKEFMYSITEYALDRLFDQIDYLQIAKKFELYDFRNKKLNPK